MPMESRPVNRNSTTKYTTPTIDPPLLGLKVGGKKEKGVRMCEGKEERENSESILTV